MKWGDHFLGVPFGAVRLSETTVTRILDQVLARGFSSRGPARRTDSGGGATPADLRSSFVQGHPPRNTRGRLGPGGVCDAVDEVDGDGFCGVG